MQRNLNKILWGAVVLIVIYSLWYSFSTGGVLENNQKHFGFLSLLPAILTLVLCFSTRNVIFALFIGVVLGGIITTRYNILNEYLIPSLGSTKYARILLVYLWALGGLIGLWNKNGGALYFANLIAHNRLPMLEIPIRGNSSMIRSLTPCLLR